MSLLAIVLAAAPLTTVAEQSGWTKTGRFDEVERLCIEFPKRYPKKVKCERFGTTPLGRPMLAFIASADGTLSPEAVRTKKRPVLFLQGGIHAGEIDGKDAGFWLLREVLDKKVAIDALTKVTLVFVPVFNIDGHERFGPNHRPNQRGPDEMGWRVTSQNLNLNRDYAKAEAPEMLAMLSLLHRYDPIMFVDLHVTDGAKFQHDVAVTFEPLRIGTSSMQTWGKALRESLFEKLTKQGHLPLDFYPSFDDEDDPQSGFSAGWPPPRFGNAYWALQHRFGVLVETHSWKPYAHRVKTTFDTCLGLLEATAENGAGWLASAQRADQDALQLGGKEVVLRYTNSKTTQTIDFSGYAYVRAMSDVSGKFWVQYDESKPEIWKMPLRMELLPSLTIKAPQVGYIISASAAPELGPKLRAHGLGFSILKKATPHHPVETFRAISPTFKPTSVEGRMTVTMKGAWQAAFEDIAAGSLFVPIGQRGAELLMHLLEPTAPDSFAAWGFFNAHLEQKEYLEDYVTEAYARERLKDSSLKQDFEQKLKDPSFAKDSSARLGYFSSIHPTADARLGVLPIYRVTTPPQ